MAKKQYTVTEWHGKQVYNCTRCPFDTLKEEVFVAHFQSAHQVRSRSGILIADSRGREVFTPVVPKEPEVKDEGKD